MAKTHGVPVSARALIQRINRKLHDDDRMIKTSRGTRASIELGRYYVLDFKRNAIMQKDVDLEATGRELQVLKRYERLVEKE